MDKSEILAGLEDLIKDRESFIEPDEPESIFVQDKAVLRAAIDFIRYAAKENPRIENLHVYEPGESIGTIVDNCEVLIAGADLQKLANAPENKPLTLEQLREMDGEPVYMVYVRHEYDGWMLCCDVQDYVDEVTLHGATPYARRPEGTT